MTRDNKSMKIPHWPGTCLWWDIHPGSGHHLVGGLSIFIPRRQAANFVSCFSNHSAEISGGWRFTSIWIILRQKRQETSFLSNTSARVRYETPPQPLAVSYGEMTRELDEIWGGANPRNGDPPHSATGAETGSQIDPIQDRGTFLWTVISKTCPRIIRAKIDFLKSVTFQFHARVLSSQLAQSLKSYGLFLDLGVEIALSHRHVKFFI